MFLFYIIFSFDFRNIEQNINYLMSNTTERELRKNSKTHVIYFCTYFVQFMPI